MSGKRSIRFGILGVGSHGARLKTILEKLGTVLWEQNSEGDYRKILLPDWVFICTPNVFHYEQALYFLKRGSNVFLEKPPVLGVEALRALIKASEETSTRLYVSDVFLRRMDLKRDLSSRSINRFEWLKSPSSDKSSPLYRFAYHHLQLIYRAVGKENPDVFIKSGRITDLYDFNINLSIDNYPCELRYSVRPGAQPRHIAFGQLVENDHNRPDALTATIEGAIDPGSDRDAGHQSTLWVLECLRKIQLACFPAVAVVGGGVFGCSSAIELANRGVNVSLHEKHADLMSAASSINQYRVHKGYHYPRSKETALECRSSAVQFEKAFRHAIVSDDIEHYYAIASENSLTTAEQYIAFLDEIQLDYQIVEPLPSTNLTVRVFESLYDPVVLKTTIEERVFGSGVKLVMGDHASREKIGPEKFVVAATYATLNEWVDNPQAYQYELCEKPVLRLPEEYKNKSIVIMDGPFMCIDPLGSSGFHVMGNVVHAIHISNIGVEPHIPERYEGLLNNGIIKDPSISKIKLFIKSAKPFFPNIERSEYLGSMYTYRVVKPYREHDDARPTLVSVPQKNTATLFSGKICTCINAASRVADVFEEKTLEADQVP